MDIKQFSSIWDVGKIDIGRLFSKPFDSIKDALFDYKSDPDDDKIKELRMMIHGYLREMNSNSKLPISHRLMVIDTLNQYIAVVQQLGIPNILETYDKVLAEVDKKAENKPQFVDALVEISVFSFHLMVTELQLVLLRYYPISPVSIRRALSIMHMVLRLYRKHQLPASVWFTRLSRLFIIHELLRAVNTNAMPPNEQKSAVKQLKKHLEAGTKFKLHFYLKGDRIQSQGLVLIIQPQKPHTSPMRSLRYDEIATEDVILLDLDQLAQFALRDMRHAQSKISPAQQGQHGDYVMVADALNDAIIFGKFMREIMYTRPRQYPRKRPEQKNSVALDTDLGHGLRMLYEQQRMTAGDGLMDPPEYNRTWQVVDMSEGGFYLEQIPIRQRPKSALSLNQTDESENAPSMEVGIMISYALTEPQETMLGEKPHVRLIEQGIARVSWYRVNANELKSIGIAKALNGSVVHLKVLRELLSVSSKDQFFGWIELIDKKQLKLWSTQEHLSPGTPIAVRLPGKAAFSCSVAKMIERGENYAVHLLTIDPPKQEAS